jgi:hypothetical protein
MAPMIRTTESWTIPSAAIMVASTMNPRKLKESSALSEVWNSTVSHTTASAGDPTARLARRAGGARDDRGDRLQDDRALALDSELAQVGDDDARVFARHVAEDEVARGLLGGTLKADDVQGGGVLAEDAIGLLGERGRSHDAQVHHRGDRRSGV